MNGGKGVAGAGQFGFDKMYYMLVFDRPGVAGAVLQTPL